MRRRSKAYGGWKTEPGTTGLDPVGQPAPRSSAVDWERVILPFLALVSAFAAAQITHVLWGRFPAVFWACLLMTISNCGLTALTWTHVHERGWLGRAHLTANTFVACTWLTVATYTGPFTRPTFDIGAWVGLTLAVAWLIRHGVHGTDTSGAAGTSVSKAVRASLDVVGLDKVRATVKEVDGPRVKTELVMPGGGTVDEVSKRLPNLESAGELPRGMARLIPDPDHANRAELVLLTENVLRDPIPWPGPLQRGLSIADAPMVVGLYEDAQHALLNFYSPAGANHLLIVGMSGAGKSMFAQACMASLFVTTDVVVWTVDVSKGAQILGDAMPGLDWAVVTGDDGNRQAAQLRALEMIDALTEVITARANFLGKHGMANWAPRAFTEHGMPFLVVWIEEAADVVMLDDNIVTVMRAARSAGVSVVMSNQRATHDLIPTSAREQFSMAMCFGTKGEREVTYVLSSELTDNGVQPAIWQRKVPGMAFLEAPDLPLERAMTPLRGYALEEGDLAAAAVWRAEHWVPAGDVTAAAAGKPYAARNLQLVTGGGPTVAGELRKDLDEVDVVRTRLLQGITDPEPDLHVPDDFDDADEPSIPLPRPADLKRETVAQAERILDDYLETLAGTGTAYTRAQIADAVKDHVLGLSRSWVFKQLRAMIGDRLVEVDSDDIKDAGAIYYRVRSRQAA